MTRRFPLILLLAAGATGCFGPDAVIGLHERIRHDDFDYVVLRVDRTPTIGRHQASGVFIIVTFRVESRAVRVGHRWDNRIAYVLDETGRVFENDADAQQELLRVEPFAYAAAYTTPAEQVQETRFVYDLPRTVTSAFLKVRGSFLMGDVFDGHRYRRTKVRLF